MACLRVATILNGVECKEEGRFCRVNIKQIVKNNSARFSFYRAGYMYYEVRVDGQAYRFPVSLEDLGTATLLAEHKAITLMRYIRKALEDHTFVKA